MQRCIFKPNSYSYCGSYRDDDSGIGLDYDYSSSSDLNSSTMSFNRPYFSTRSTSPIFPKIRAVERKRINPVRFIRFPSDGISQRIRPATMRNSENGDFIICHTNRGAYVAYRTPIVPDWVTRLVQEIEAQQR